MKKFIILITLLWCGFAYAELQFQDNNDSNIDLQEYFAESRPNYNKSIIYIFYNNNPCENCAQAIELIEQAYNQNFANNYSLLLIDYQDDREYNFIENYNLSRPLEVVLQRVDDGATFGFKKLENLQNQTSDPISFQENFINEVNNFLGDY